MKQTIGHRLREAREAAGLTQDQLADRVDITQGYLSQVESDKAVPTIGVMFSLAKSLGVKMGAIFGEDQP